MAKNKALTLATGLLFGASSAFAQNPESYYEEIPRTFYGGVIGGVNLTQVDGDNYAGYHKVGFNFGGILYAKFDEHVAASIEILYSQKGSRGHYDQGPPGLIVSGYNIKLNYAEVPLQLCYFDRRKSHFGAGISVARLASVQEEGSLNGHSYPDFDKYPFRKMDYNLIIGGSLHIWQGLFFNARFQYSLRPIRKGTLGVELPANFAGRGEQYNNMWTTRLMYLF